MTRRDLPELSGGGEAGLTVLDLFSDIIAFRLVSAEPDRAEGVEIEPRLSRRKLIAQLREREAMHESPSFAEGTSENLRGVVQGWNEAFGEVADWIESGDFDTFDIEKAPPTPAVEGDGAEVLSGIAAKILSASPEHARVIYGPLSHDYLISEMFVRDQLLKRCVGLLSAPPAIESGRSVDDAMTFLIAAAEMLERGNMPSAGTPYAKQWAAMMRIVVGSPSQEQAGAVAEPIAWRYRNGGGGPWRVTDYDIGQDWPSLNCEPLYAHPHQQGAVAWPEKWSGDCTVGNMIANLSSLPPEMPIFTGYHIIMNDGKSHLKVKRPTLSRERVDGTNIKTGDETVPYSAVIWTHPRDPNDDAERQQGAVEVARKALEPSTEGTPKEWLDLIWSWVPDDTKRYVRSYRPYDRVLAALSAKGAGQ